MRLVAAIMFFLLVVAGCSYSADVRVRPLSLTVVDAETGKPVPHVPVYYELLTAGPKRFLLFLHRIDPVIYRAVVRKAYITDEKGEVMIDGNVAPLRRYEEIFREAIYINIESEENPKERYDATSFFSSASIGRLLYNPNKNYIGVLLRTAARTFDSGEKRGINFERKDIVLESILIDNSLAKESDAIEIQLKKTATSDNCYDSKGKGVAP